MAGTRRPTPQLSFPDEVALAIPPSQIFRGTTMTNREDATSAPLLDTSHTCPNTSSPPPPLLTARLSRAPHFLPFLTAPQSTTTPPCPPENKDHCSTFSPHCSTAMTPSSPSPATLYLERLCSAAGGRGRSCQAVFPAGRAATIPQGLMHRGE